MTPPKVRTSDFEVSGADEMEHFLTGAYGTSIRIRAETGPHLMRHHRTEAGLVAFKTIYQSADLRFEVEPLHTVIIASTTTSQMERASGSADRRYGSKELFAMSYPELPYTTHLLPGQLRTAVIDLALLARVAATAPARRPQPLRLTALDPRSPQAAARWEATRAHIATLLATPETADQPLLIATSADLLAAVTLDTFPSTALDDPTIEDRRDAHPATLRRAMAFIDENAQRGISIADIAAAAFVTPRAVQLAFRTHLDTTPTDYLRGVRLDHAHRDLMAGDPARETVTSIAYRWGFPSASRFSAYYRLSYGVPPSHTLRNR